ncbi:unnamed protein product [Rotaria sp. Silwood1]|nr:unnamed protein product [Rotaria sp. Silwood1]
MDRLRSPYIVTFYGACIETQKQALITEYMSLGSLYKLLHEDNLVLSWSQQQSISLQIAKGINYLHQLQPSVLHRDIKSGNFLLERAYEGYTVKVCDFGLAKTRNETSSRTSSSHSLACTLQWTAPEILRLEHYTEKSDIYSLGVVYWELITKQKPYDGYNDGVIRAFVLAKERLPIPDTTPSTFCAVVEKCWAHSPNDRPNTSDLIGMIEKCVHLQSNSLITILS